MSLLKNMSLHRCGAIDSLKSCGVDVEVNTTGWKEQLGIGDGYPTVDFLKAVNNTGISTVTIGSDSHHVENLGVFFDRAAKRLDDAGYNYYCIVEKRRSTKIYLTNVANKSIDNHQSICHLRLLRNQRNKHSSACLKYANFRLNINDILKKKIRI
ncbi:MAG: histidinol-phosphatase family [Thermoproteota archaeon]|nr:histidinol-phosphatase family [Thermoproteota archaeon]